MVRRSAIRFGFAIVVLVGGVRVAAAQSQTTTSPSADPVLAGYLRLYSGDRDGAYRHFETLRAREPENLAFWYGQLFAHESRIDLRPDRKSTRLNSSHDQISYAVFCLKKKK